MRHEFSPVGATRRARDGIIERMQAASGRYRVAFRERNRRRMRLNVRSRTPSHMPAASKFKDALRAVSFSINRSACSINLPARPPNQAPAVMTGTRHGHGGEVRATLSGHRSGGLDPEDVVFWRTGGYPVRRTSVVLIV